MSTPPPPPPLPAPPLPAMPAPGRSAPIGGPTVSLPRPPGPWSAALSRTWSTRASTLPTPAWVGAGVAGVAAGALLLTEQPGLGAALVALAAWAPVAWLLLRRRGWLDLVTATGALVLVASVAVRDADWVIGIAVATGLAAAAVALGAGRSARAVLLAPFAVMIGGLQAAPMLTSLARRSVGARREVVLRTLRSVALTMLLLLVFGALFASADALFAAYLPDIDLGSLPGRIVLGVLVGLAVTAAAHLAMLPPSWPAADQVRPARQARLSEWLAPLVALDALVVTFLAVQVSGLVAGHGYVAATTGLTYAQYARAGFGQLVVVTALTLVVIGVAARRAPRGTPRDRRISSVVLGLLGVGTLGVVASALRRMTLYVDAYGLTRLRILVLVAEVVLGVVVLLVLAAGVRWRARWLPRAAVHAVMAGVLALVALNPDALVVRYDAVADAPVDVGYLAGLSADALPDVAALDEPLRTCLLALAQDDAALRGQAVDAGGWAAWNSGRAAGARVLDAAGPLDVDPGTCRPGWPAD